MSPAEGLKRLIGSKRPVRAMAAHSPLSARLAEEAGFEAIWASGFELSALYGLPDASLVSMTQHLDMTRAICRACQLPVIADLDTGFGNAVNVIHAVQSYAEAGVAAVVIEDKFFPKMTSLIEGGRQDLVTIAEFEGKIRAAADVAGPAGPLIIARTEALISGRGEQEALTRAHAYAGAGADLILVHSKGQTPEEIVSFCRSWNGSVPLVLVPTTYPELGLSELAALSNVAIVIYGNHAVRACVQAMQQTFSVILADGNSLAADKQIATVEEVFRLQGMDEIKRQEQEYLR